ncbi:MAG TPA: ribbon-helix-helix protein, CopG family [Gemmatimonadota bacterium]|nr:ribbon-helix-helix protein, CopG family [Gemmatimonadota bacterium]
MRTTVRLPDELMRQIKHLATETDRTFTRVIEDALREVLARHRKRETSDPPIEPAELPTFRGTGPAPGVDLDDRAALLDLMEEDLPIDKRR